MSEPLALRRDQVKLLDHLSRGEQSVGEIAAALDRRHGPIITALGTLQRRGLVEFTPTSEHSAPGRPRGRWSLTKKGQAVCEPVEPPKQLSAVDRLGTDQISRLAGCRLTAHQSFVSVAVNSSAVPDLLGVLSSAQAAAEASCVARLDGDLHRYIFLFDQDRGARPAEVLASVLATAQLSVEFGTIADARTIDEFLLDAAALATAAQSASGPPARDLRVGE